MDSVAPGPLQRGGPRGGKAGRGLPAEAPSVPQMAWKQPRRPRPPAVGRGPRPAFLRDRPPSLAGAARSNQLKSRIDGCLASGGRAAGCPSGAAAGRASWKRLGRGPSGGSCRLGRLPPSPTARWGCLRPAGGKPPPAAARFELQGSAGSAPACWVTLSRRPTSSGKVSGSSLGARGWALPLPAGATAASDVRLPFPNPARASGGSSRLGSLVQVPSGCAAGQGPAPSWLSAARV